jgi:hypothetical protein
VTTSAEVSDRIGETIRAKFDLQHRTKSREKTRDEQRLAEKYDSDIAKLEAASIGLMANEVADEFAAEPISAESAAAVADHLRELRDIEGME